MGHWQSELPVEAGGPEAPIRLPVAVARLGLAYCGGGGAVPGTGCGLLSARGSIAELMRGDLTPRG